MPSQKALDENGMAASRRGRSSGRRNLISDFSSVWRGIVSFEARFRSGTGEPVLVEVELALGPPYQTEWIGSVLSFGKMEWGWVSHNLDPFLYVDGGRVRAANPEAGYQQRLLFELRIGSIFILYVIAALLVWVLTPAPFGLAMAGSALLVCVIQVALLPRLFAAKVQRLIDSVETG
jgi:hypothetical protein